MYAIRIEIHTYKKRISVSNNSRRHTHKRTHKLKRCELQRRPLGM